MDEVVMGGVKRGIVGGEQGGVGRGCGGWQLGTGTHA